MKKRKVLADLFFDSNNEKNIFKIFADIRQCKDIVYYDDYYEIYVDPINLEEYLTRFDTYFDCGQLIIGQYDYIHVYQIAVDIIRSQAEILKETTYDQYKLNYDGWQLDLPVVKGIKYYDIW